jgi:hypothetical protein
MKEFSTIRFISILLVLALSACGGGGGGGTVVTVTSSIGEVLFAGEVTELTISTNSGISHEFRLEVSRIGEPARIVNDYSGKTAYSWSSLDEGSYEIIMSARNSASGLVIQEVLIIDVVSQPMAAPAIIPTTHPLIVQYKVPAQVGSGSVRVLFREIGTTPFFRTASKEFTDGVAANLYVAGMKANTTYEMQHEVLSPRSESISRGVLLQTTTGPIVDVLTPDFFVISPVSGSTSVEEPFILFNPIQGTPENPRFPFACDLAGNIVWYPAQLLDKPQSRINRPVTGGTFLVAEGGFVQEIDVAGNTLRETNYERINEQLEAMGEMTILGTHHETRRLPNGHTVILGYIEELYDDVPGETGTVDILADMIIVLDENFQVAWVWNAFDHLNVDRVAILGEVCEQGDGGCPGQFLLAEQANDWMHSNAVDYSPIDGNLILSVRHQDWIIKVAYEDGNGDGHVIWRLGEEGDFDLTAAGTHPWFTHPHDPNFIDDNVIVVYDNGNTRSELFDEKFSRGQVYELDESNMTATLVLNFDLGNYSPALGSAQQLSNGNFYFNSGFQFPQPLTTTADEVLPDGTLDHGIQVDAAVYRSFRLKDMYTAPHDWME